MPSGSSRSPSAWWTASTGIGGGSLLAPILIAAGLSVDEVAPATLAATFLTSIAGIGAYQVLQLTYGGAIAPDWGLGVWLGAGGFAGSYVGARLQGRLPESSLRRLLGLVACAVAARYIQTAATYPRPATARATAAVEGSPAAVRPMLDGRANSGSSFVPAVRRPTARR